MWTKSVEKWTKKSPEVSGLAGHRHAIFLQRAQKNGFITCSGYH